MTYQAPLKDILFTLDHIVGFGDLIDSGAFPDLSRDLAEAVLSEAGKFAEGVLAPLNAAGDREGAQLANGVVTTPKGFKTAYDRFAAGGWCGLPFDPDYGGQGLPKTLMLTTQMIWQGANLSFGLAPILTEGAIEALTHHGTEEQKQKYLRPLIEGRWTGTMNLSEPQAGSDVGALTAKAVPQEDGSYRIFGTKIWISWGEHDLTENILHLVLARLPDAPAGNRGISLFLVPKVQVNQDGSLGARNDLICGGIEEKLGIHASPTCVMNYGEAGEGAWGEMIGAPNKGLAAMFTMMNSARVNVGVQGLGIADAAFAKALAYAKDRHQGKPWSNRHGDGAAVAIIEHPDVRRMLMDMKARTEAMRAICAATTLAGDRARTAEDHAARHQAQHLEDLLTPVAKSWCTDGAVEVASTGIQIHGGMGYVEETGAAQYLRDARVLTIYEGTNGIQAMDFAMRKLPTEDGAVLQAVMEEIRSTAAIAKLMGDDLAPIAAPLVAGADAVTRTANWMLERQTKTPDAVLEGATPFLNAFGTVLGAHFLTRGAIAAARALKEAPGDAHLKLRVDLARHFAAHTLPIAEGLCKAASAGDSTRRTGDALAAVS